MKNKTIHLGMLLAFALILSYIETFIPIPFAIPGIKLGLANLSVVLCLYLFDFKSAILISVAKAALSGLLFGNLYMIIYSLSGAILSCVIMTIMHKSSKFHLPIVSATGGIMHNIGQLAVAYFTVKTYGLVYYMPFLLISGFLTGVFIGIISTLILPYISRILKRSERL